MPSRGRNGAADWLSLAAAPVFLLMAALTVVAGGGAGDVHGSMRVGGMATMYGLMSLFHSAPWLRLSARQS